MGKLVHDDKSAPTDLARVWSLEAGKDWAGVADGHDKVRVGVDLDVEVIGLGMADRVAGQFTDQEPGGGHQRLVPDRGDHFRDPVAG